MLWYRIDGEFCHGFTISGYNIGIDNEQAAVTVYQINITNCATAVLANSGRPMAADGCTFSGDVGISRTSNGGVSYFLDSCTIVGGSGTAIDVVGNSTSTTFQFHNCPITGTMNNNGCVFNLTDCALSGSPQCS
jgi:hypothetical protein